MYNTITHRCRAGLGLRTDSHADKYTNIHQDCWRRSDCDDIDDSSLDTHWYLFITPIVIIVIINLTAMPHYRSYTSVRPSVRLSVPRKFLTQKLKISEKQKLVWTFHKVAENLQKWCTDLKAQIPLLRLSSKLPLRKSHRHKSWKLRTETISTHVWSVLSTQAQMQSCVWQYKSKLSATGLKWYSK